MKRRILSFLLVCVMILGMTPMVSFADTTASWEYPTAEPSQPFASGDGTESNPYIIATAQQLANLAYMTNKDENRQTYANTYFKLGNNIDLENQTWANPIADECNFQGTFDGAGHTISNFSSKGGLFDVVGTAGIIMNLTVSGSISGGTSINNSAAYASIVRYNHGTIQNCINNECSVNPNGEYSGGIAGQSDGTIIGCVNKGKINETNGAKYVGGIVGYNSGEITNCRNEASIGEGSYSGGIAGYAASNSNIINCYNTGNIEGGGYSGGILGYDGYGNNVANCYSAAAVVSTSYNDGIVGGIIGGKATANPTIVNCYWLTAAGITSACGVEATVTSCSSFTSSDYKVDHDGNPDTEAIALVEALNAWVTVNTETYTNLKQWTAEEGTAPTFVNKAEAEITLLSTVEGTYGTDITLIASTTATGENGAWSWTVPDESFGVVSGEATNSIVLKPLKVGTALDVTATYESDTHLGSATVSVNITAKALTITGVTAEDRSYVSGNTTVTLTGGALVGVVEGDSDIGFTLGTGTIDNANAGTDKAVTTNITLTGAASGNYTLTQPTDIKVNIEKAIPSYTTPTGLTATFGQTLADVNPGSNWAWESPSTTEVGAIGTATHTAVFTKDNSGNYEPVRGVEVSITVSKAAAPTLTDTAINHVAGTNTQQSKELVLAGMPSNAGNLTFTTAGAATVSSSSIEQPVVWSIGESGTLTYTISGGAIGDAVTFPIKISSDNYADTTVNVVVTIAEASSTPTNPGSNKPSRPSSKPAAPTEEQKPADEQTTGSAVTPVANPFTDVDENDFFSESVLWAVENGITEGTAKTKFSPYKSCTRAEALTFIWRANGSPTPSSVTIPFTDVDEDAYYINAILWGIENGITNGLTDTTFGPDKTCARAEILTFLWRASGSSQPASTANPFVDVSAGAYYMNSVLWGVDEEITNGTSETTFGPDDSCTRGQIVTFLYRDMVE